MDIENYNVSESPKVANVRPIYKKKSKNGLENYRPLLLLNTFSKIYERYTYNSITHLLILKISIGSFHFRFLNQVY